MARIMLIVLALMLAGCATGSSANLQKTAESPPRPPSIDQPGQAGGPGY